MTTDFDTALSILENGTRRGILERLVREPHYPLQLADLLNVSQQAVMKHLKVLESAGFVTSEKVPSEKGVHPSESMLSPSPSPLGSTSARICFALSIANFPREAPFDWQVDFPMRF